MERSLAGAAASSSSPGLFPTGDKRSGKKSDSDGALLPGPVCYGPCRDGIRPGVRLHAYRPVVGHDVHGPVHGSIGSRADGAVSGMGPHAPRNPTPSARDTGGSLPRLTERMALDPAERSLSRTTRPLPVFSPPGSRKESDEYRLHRSFTHSYTLSHLNDSRGLTRLRETPTTADSLDNSPPVDSWPRSRTSLWLYAASNAFPLVES